MSHDEEEGDDAAEEDATEEGADAEPALLLNPLHGASVLDETESEEIEEEEEEGLGVRIIQIKNDNIDAGKNLEYTELCQLK